MDKDKSVDKKMEIEKRSQMKDRDALPSMTKDSNKVEVKKKERR